MSEESKVPPVTGTFLALILIGFFAQLSYGMARTPLLALFARPARAGPVLAGFLLSHYDYLSSFARISVILLLVTALFQYHVREPDA
jgi:hypothetical protein